MPRRWLEGTQAPLLTDPFAQLFDATRSEQLETPISDRIEHRMD
jgi:hypothetical protein